MRGGRGLCGAGLIACAVRERGLAHAGLRRPAASQLCLAGPGAAMAATFFGEVVKAPCRAGTEDEEEEEEGRRETPEDREVRQQLARKR